MSVSNTLGPLRHVLFRRSIAFVPINATPSPPPSLPPVPLAWKPLNHRAVKAGGDASKANVRVKDVVRAVNGNPCPSYDSLIAIIGAVGRPVQVEFQRLGTDGGVGGGGGGAGAARSQDEGSGHFQRAQEAARRKMEELKGPSQVESF